MVEREKSEFNQAISKLNRINLYIIEAGIARTDPINVSKWIQSLINIFLELSTKMKPSEKQLYKEKMFRLKHTANKITNVRIKNNMIKIPAEFYNEMIEFELSMRDIMREAGLDDRLIGEDGGVL